MVSQSSIGISDVGVTSMEGTLVDVKPPYLVLLDTIDLTFV